MATGLSVRKTDRIPHTTTVICTTLLFWYLCVCTFVRNYKTTLQKKCGTPTINSEKKIGYKLGRKPLHWNHPSMGLCEWNSKYVSDWICPCRIKETPLHQYPTVCQDTPYPWFKLECGIRNQLINAPDLLDPMKDEKLT